MKHTIDATGKPLGRLASEISVLLRGKDDPTYRPHENREDCSVLVTNVEEIVLTGKKMEQKEYFRHSGYLGGDKKKKISVLPKSEVLRRAVYGMLPKNRLRDRIIKRLEFKSND